MNYRTKSINKSEKCATPEALQFDARHRLSFHSDIGHEHKFYIYPHICFFTHAAIVTYIHSKYVRIILFVRFLFIVNHFFFSYFPSIPLFLDFKYTKLKITVDYLHGSKFSNLINNFVLKYT